MSNRSLRSSTRRSYEGSGEEGEGALTVDSTLDQRATPADSSRVPKVPSVESVRRSPPRSLGGTASRGKGKGKEKAKTFNGGGVVKRQYIRKNVKRVVNPVDPEKGLASSSKESPVHERAQSISVGNSTSPSFIVDPSLSHYQLNGPGLGPIQVGIHKPNLNSTNPSSILALSVSSGAPQLKRLPEDSLNLSYEYVLSPKRPCLNSPPPAASTSQHTLEVDQPPQFAHLLNKAESGDEVDEYYKTLSIPTRAEFEEQMRDYLVKLNEKKRFKALITRDMYTMILSILLNPSSTTQSTAQFRFWSKNMFRLHYSAGTSASSSPPILTREGKPVAIQENIYDILVLCHQLSYHGGRDRTNSKVKERWSWVPKELAGRFVKMCKGCKDRKKGGEGDEWDEEDGEEMKLRDMEERDQQRKEQRRRDKAEKERMRAKYYRDTYSGGGVHMPLPQVQPLPSQLQLPPLPSQDNNHDPLHLPSHLAQPHPYFDGAPSTDEHHPYHPLNPLSQLALVAAHHTSPFLAPPDQYSPYSPPPRVSPPPFGPSYADSPPSTSSNSTGEWRYNYCENYYEGMWSEGSSATGITTGRREENGEDEDGEDFAEYVRGDSLGFEDFEVKFESKENTVEEEENNGSKMKGGEASEVMKTE